MKIFNKVLAIFFVATLIFSLNLSSVIIAATAVNLSSADNFAILAGSAITETGTTAISGDVGLSPSTGANITGLTATEVTGTIYAVDAAGPAGSVNNPALVNAAKDDLVTAYNNAAAQSTSSTVPTELGGTTKTAGVYDSAAGTFGITGTLTLDAQGDANAVFIFKAASTLVTAGSSVVNLVNGTQACNVFWQVGSSATLGTASNFKGNILALTSITDNGGSTVGGRLLARNGAVTLNNTTVTKATCAASATSTPTPTPGSPSAGGVPQNGKITVIKAVINDSGRTKVVSDFPLFVNGVRVFSGETNTFSSPAPAYTVTETADPNYTQTFSGDCDVNGRVSLNPGENKFCIVTNNDIGAPLPVVPPLIDVVKVPSPLALPAGPGPVTYTYTLTNIGTVPVTDVTMVGDTCNPIVRTSGDVNGDNKLDVSETWTYRCSTTLSATHTNIVTTTGWANGISAVDVATATVVVGAPVVPPLIHVTKVPSPLALFSRGGVVAYTMKVSNPGTVALGNVRLTDDKCAVASYVSGDIDRDSMLDIAETWTYTCSTNLTKTTVNTVIASGDANGLTARDLAVATVVVATPKLPSTGIAPDENNTPWGIVIPSGIFAVLALFYFARRKQTV